MLRASFLDTSGSPVQHHRYPDDLKGPQLVIVVPHRELGVQICMLAYRLFGGSVNAGIPGESANMFTYTGPRGIRVRGCLDKEEVLRAKNAAYLNGCHVVVGTPDCLAECLLDPSPFPVMQHTKARFCCCLRLLLPSFARCLCPRDGAHSS